MNTNLYNSQSDNERMRIVRCDLGGQNWMESFNEFLKWVQKDSQDIVKPDKK